MKNKKYRIISKMGYIDSPVSLTIALDTLAADHMSGARIVEDFVETGIELVLNEELGTEMIGVAEYHKRGKKN